MSSKQHLILKKKNFYKCLKTNKKTFFAATLHLFPRPCSYIFALQNDEYICYHLFSAHLFLSFLKGNCESNNCLHVKQWNTLQVFQFRLQLLINIFHCQCCLFYKNTMINWFHYTLEFLPSYPDFIPNN